MKRAALIQTVIFCLLIACAAVATASEDGDRSLFLNDNSFENGICGEGSGWTCWTDTSCPNWIIDPLPVWGVPAHDGTYVAQLGGSCDAELNSNSFCQDISGLFCGFWVTWSYLGISSGDNPGSFRVTADGETIDSEPTGTVVDTAGVWETGWFSGWAEEETMTICFEFDAGSDESAMLIDSVSNLISPTPTLPFSFSAVKSLY